MKKPNQVKNDGQPKQMGSELGHNNTVGGEPMMSDNTLKK